MFLVEMRFTCCLLFLSALVFAKLNATQTQINKAKPSIIIVGAGISGLAAATRLIDYGFKDIKILEAENRIGGRVYSIKTGNWTVDYGAHWIPGQKGNPVFDLAEPLGLLKKVNDFCSDDIKIFSDNKELTINISEVSYNLHEIRNNITYLSNSNESFHTVLSKSIKPILRNLLNDDGKENAYISWLSKKICTEEGCDTLSDVSAKGQVCSEGGGSGNVVGWNGKGYGTIVALLLCTQFVKGSHSKRVHDALLEKAHRWFEQHKMKAFFVLGENASDESQVAKALMRLCGLGKLRPNMILMGYKADWQTCPRKDLDHYFSLIHVALDSYMAVGILRLSDGLDYSKMIEGEDPTLSPIIERKCEIKLSRNISAGQLSLDDACSQSSSPSGSIRAEDGIVLESSSSGKEGTDDMYRDPKGQPLSSHHLAAITQFRRKQQKGFIDVWWLYDDGGLTLLIPHILSRRSQYSECKLRIFSLANRRNELDRAHRNLAALLSKFRIDYSDLIIIPDITKKARPETVKEFEELIKGFRSETHKNEDNVNISDSELSLLSEKTNRHMRLRELLIQHSHDSTFIVVTLPMPRKGTVSAPLYMAWLELITAGMPPCLILRGNQTSVLTYYS